MSTALSGGSVVVAAKDQLSCDLDGETAILNMKTGVYYGLDTIGARIWNLIQQPRSVQEVGAALSNEYDVEPERCEKDVHALLEKFLDEGLIEVRDGASP